MELINPKKYIKKFKFAPSKKMGQNFLVDEFVIQEIIDQLDNAEYDAIIEIGPGLGALTKYLYKLNVDLHLIELDKRLFAYLNERFGKEQNVKLYCQDVLQTDLDEIAKNYKNCIIVSNLPYSISSLVIIKFLKTKKIKTMYCMLQKELVERMICKPKSRIYNSFSVLVQKQATVDKLTYIDNSSFVPPPEVQSNFICITKKHNSQYNEEFNKFVKFIFSAKRKTMWNNLKVKLSTEQISKLYDYFKLNRNIRSEELTYQEIEKIHQFLKGEGNV